MPFAPAGLRALRARGMDSVQLSIQDADAGCIGHDRGHRVFDAKLEVAASVRELGIALTLNVVLHREISPGWGDHGARASDSAIRLELANAQYLGWALQNRAELMPTRGRLDAARAISIGAPRSRRGIEILFVMPDYHRVARSVHGGLGTPAPGGGARRPRASVSGAAELPGLEWGRVPERPLAESGPTRRA